MKTILTKIAALCLIFLFTLLHAQNEEEYAYRGGIADGFANEAVQNVSCSTPDFQFAYFGGAADGAATETLADNATCSTPFHHFAYFGGAADGAAAETPELLTCATPYHFYAYFGGIGDGAASGKTTDVCPIDPPVADFTASETTTCVGRVVTFTDTSSNKPTGWSWTFDGGTPGTANTKTVNVVYSTPGSYKVTLQVVNYNGSDTVTRPGYITVLSDCSTLGTSAATTRPKIQLYPNPTRNILYLKAPDNVLQIEVYDASGRKLMEAKPNLKEAQLNLQRLNAGIYLVKTRTLTGEQVHKVIKRD